MANKILASLCWNIPINVQTLLLNYFWRRFKCISHNSLILSGWGFKLKVWQAIQELRYFNRYCTLNYLFTCDNLNDIKWSSLKQFVDLFWFFKINVASDNIYLNIQDSRMVPAVIFLLLTLICGGNLHTTMLIMPWISVVVLRLTDELNKFGMISFFNSFCSYSIRQCLLIRWYANRIG